MTKILGVDPGLRTSGWGVIQVCGNRLQYHGHGLIQVPAQGRLSQRLHALLQGIEAVLDNHRPDMVAVEETFVNTNGRSTLKLGQARGVLMVAPARLNIPVYEYATNAIKKAIVGVGHAQKQQVMTMIQHLLPTCDKATLTADGADALAVAICHAHHRDMHLRTG